MKLVVFFVRHTQHLKKTLNVVGVYIAYYKEVSLSLVRLTSRFGSLRESPAGGYCSGNIHWFACIISLEHLASWAPLLFPENVPYLSSHIYCWLSFAILGLRVCIFILIWLKAFCKLLLTFILPFNCLPIVLRRPAACSSQLAATVFINNSITSLSQDFPFLKWPGSPALSNHVCGWSTPKPW